MERQAIANVNEQQDETEPVTSSTSPDRSVITHNVPEPAGCEPETAVETHTPGANMTRSGRVVKPVVKVTL